MEQISLVFSKIRNKNKYLLHIMAAVLCCLIVVSGLLFFMPTGYADSGDRDSPIGIDANSKTQSVERGKYYKISGTSTDGLKLNIIGTAGDVNIILEEAEFFMTGEEPAIEFDYKQEGDTENTSQVNVNLILSKDSTIIGRAGSKAPLIKAESYQYATETFDDKAATEDTAMRPTYVSQKIALTISEINSDDRNTLTLITGEGSYGAAIGSGEAQWMVDNMGIELKYDYNNPTDYFNNGVIYYKGAIFFKSDYKFTYGSAPVTIKSGVVEIEGNGYGAGIGNGGAVNSVISIKKQDKVTVIDTVSLPTAENVKISNGSVAVVMTAGSKGSCFRNGSVAGATASDGLVTIDGGSIYLKRQDSKTPYENAYNSKDEKLYLYIANYLQDLSGNNGDLSTFYNLENVFDTEVDYKYVMTRYKNAAGGYSQDWDTEKIVSLNADVTLTNGNYNFEGYCHSDKYREESDQAYFYLPAIKLNSYLLEITDDYGENIEYDTSIRAEILNQNPEYVQLVPGYEKYNKGGIYVKQTRSVYIRVKNVPSYCEKVSMEFVLKDDDGKAVASGQRDVFKGTDGNYYTCLTAGEGNVVCKFTYEMGTYTINYEYGLLDSDKNAVIKNTNPKTAECGKGVTLVEPVWDNHVFSGWYSDRELKNEITSVSSFRPDEKINVYAKWQCVLTFETEDGELTGGLKEQIVDYGSTINIYADAPTVKLDDISLFKFLGWEVDGTLYSDKTPGTANIIVTSNKTIKASFERLGYFVYLTSEYEGESGKTDIKKYTKTFGMVYANNTALDFSNTFNSDMYYRTVGIVDRKQLSILKVVPKDGYKITSKSAKDVNGNPIGLFAGDNNQNEFSFSMPDKDVYITIKFDVEEYTIKYYDVVDGKNVEIDKDDNKNPSTYNMNTPSFKFVKPDNRSKYWKFAGWKKLGSDAIIEGIDQNSLAENLVLFANWEEVELFDINILKQPLGKITAYVEGHEVTKAAEGEEVTIVASSGVGIRINKLGYTWTDSVGSTTTKEQAPSDSGINTTQVMKFTMPPAKVNVSGDFEAVEYKISYLNLFGAENNNPDIYTVLDNIELEAPVKEGFDFKGWKLVTADLLTEDESDVILVDITTIENMSGNLMLYAEWEKGIIYPKVHSAKVDPSIVNGVVVLDKEEAAINDYVFVNASAKNGYKLSSIACTYETDNVLARRSLFRTFDLNDVSIEVLLNEVADGIYYFIMPDNDVKVSAEFEIVEYSIEYKADGGTHDNKPNYTVEDDLILSDAKKEGYEFLGWYDENESKIDEILSSTGDIVLVAKWQKIPTDNNNTGNNNTDNNNTDNNNNTGNNNTDNNNTDNNNTGNNNTDNNNNNTNNTDNNNSNNNVNGEDDKNKNTYVKPGGVQTGDNTDIVKLVLICIICAVVAFVVLIKTKKDDKEDEENKKS